MIRDRIKSLRRVRAGDLKPSPRNWREHPEAQRAAMQGVLEQVGYADALLARELPDGTLELIDGHLRADLDPEQEVPVLILDVDEAEAGILLATIDPLAAMAEANEEALATLLEEIEANSEGLAAMLEGLAEEAGENTGESVSSVDVGDLAYRVIVTVEDEHQQANLIERLESEGFTCLPLMS